MRARSSWMQIAAVALCLTSAGVANAAQGSFPLFTTIEDFTPIFSSDAGSPELPHFTITQSADADLDGATINGLGNPNGQAGAAGTPGGLSVVWNAGTYNFIFSGGEQGNSAFLNRLGTAGRIRFDYTQPPAGTGNYIDLGLVLNYEGAFDQFFGSTTSLGNNRFRTNINYTLSAPRATYSYFQLGLIYNSNFNTNTPFFVDNIRLYVPLIRGDANQDDLVDANDIPALLAALVDLTAYQTAHPGLSDNADLQGVLDIDLSGAIDNSDIQSLLDQISFAGGGSVSTVPEPAAWTLCLVAACVVARARRRFGRRAP